MSVNIEEIGKQLKESLNTDVAIIDKYGFILSSSLIDFKKGGVLSTTLLDFINARSRVALELNSEEINSLVLTISGTNFVFTYGKQLFIMTKIPDHVDLSEFLPSINRFITILDKSSSSIEIEDFKEFDISDELIKIEKEIEDETTRNEKKYVIFTDIVKHINEL
ncbi:MAG: hypothetical protein JW776_00975 [Candidatus Lokiarchaeota archaeon]|nr:hypothetical protein [Candidatus Lokiarchaeota archaeon]